MRTFRSLGQTEHNSSHILGRTEPSNTPAKTQKMISQMLSICLSVRLYERTIKANGETMATGDAIPPSCSLPAGNETPSTTGDSR
jgi:hypothetical protein